MWSSLRSHSPVFSGSSYSCWVLCSWTSMFQVPMFWSCVPRIIYYEDSMVPGSYWMFSEFYVPWSPCFQCSCGSMFSEFYLSVSKMFPRYPCSYPGCDVSQTPGFYSLASPEYYVPVVLWFWVLFDQDPYVPREHCSQELILWGSQGLVSGSRPPRSVSLICSYR